MSKYPRKNCFIPIHEIYDPFGDAFCSEIWNNARLILALFAIDLLWASLARDDSDYPSGSRHNILLHSGVNSSANKSRNCYLSSSSAKIASPPFRLDITWYKPFGNSSLIERAIKPFSFIFINGYASWIHSMYYAMTDTFLYVYTYAAVLPLIENSIYLSCLRLIAIACKYFWIK